MEQDANQLKNLCFYIVTIANICINAQNAGFEDIFGEGVSVWEKVLRFETVMDCKFWLRTFLCEVAEYIRKKNNENDQFLVRQIKDFISDNLNKSISLSMISSVVHYTPNYLNRIFKNAIGITITDYILEQKIEEAKKMLVMTDVRIRDIVDNLSYSHTAYFSKIFKKHTGMTPQEYRDRVV